MNNSNIDIINFIRDLLNQEYDVVSECDNDSEVLEMINDSIEWIEEQRVKAHQIIVDSCCYYVQEDFSIRTEERIISAIDSNNVTVGTIRIHNNSENAVLVSDDGATCSISYYEVCDKTSHELAEWIVRTSY